MLTIFGKSRSGFCDRLGRRNFLRVGAFGAVLTLVDLLKARGEGISPPHKAVIMVYLEGGACHLDTYDLKPDAPREFRGVFSPISTNVPGIQICEAFDKQAQNMDKVAILRAVVGMEDNHSDCQVMSGWFVRNGLQVTNGGHPSMGAVISRQRALRNAAIPPFVSLRGLTSGLEPGNLGIGHRAFSSHGQAGDNTRLPAGVSLEHLEERTALLRSFDTLRRDLDNSGTMKGMDMFRERAFAMVTSDAVRRALDVEQEDPRIRARYGAAKHFLMARRLVEAGVGFVTLKTPETWDTHDQHFTKMRSGPYLPFLDTGLSALIEDLHQRGLANDVLVVVWGEFSRTPRINGAAGRDHWANVMFCLLAGGGLRMGQVIGSTTARGEEARDGRYTVQNVHATIYRFLGIDPATTFPDRAGRPVYVLDDRTVVRELFP
jgi:uncharacterized protein (DUF1501 family)